MIGIYSGALSRRRKNFLFPQTRRCCVQMLRPFIYLTSFSVMFFLTEFALHTHLNAFGAQTMTALYAAAMFINGCGYLLFPLLARTRMPAVNKNLLVPAASALFVLSAALAEIFAQPGPRLLFSFAAMAVGGFLGGASLWAAAVALRPTGMTGKLYAAAIAASVAVQYPIQNYFAAPHFRLAAVAAAAALFVRAMPPSFGEPARRLPPQERRTPAAEFLFAAAMVVLLSYFYSLGDGVLMKLNAEGKLTVFKWPRLFYILSLMVAGWAADLRSGRALAVISLAAAALTAFYPFLLASGSGGYQIFHLCFWCFAGFYVVCFSVPFMRMAEERNFPELWACLGRIIKQFVNCAGVGQDNKTVRKLRRRSIHLGPDRSLGRALDILVQRRARRRDGGVARFRAAYRRRRNLRAGHRRRSPGRPAADGRRTRGGLRRKIRPLRARD